MSTVDVWGSVATISSTQSRERCLEIVKVRNVAHSLSLVMDIGELLAWSKLLSLALTSIVTWASHILTRIHR